MRARLLGFFGKGNGNFTNIGSLVVLTLIRLINFLVMITIIL